MEMDFAGIIAEGRTGGIERDLPDKSFLAMQDDILKSVFLIKSGLVKIYRSGDDGKEMLIGMVGANELLGELEFFLGIPLFCHMQCVGSTSITEIPHTEFLSLIDGNREFRNSLLRSLSARLHRSTIRTDDAVSGSLERVLVKMIGENSRQGISFTRKMYADYLGVSERTINRAIRRMEDQGLLSRKGRILRVIIQN